MLSVSYSYFNSYTLTFHLRIGHRVSKMCFRQIFNFCLIKGYFCQTDSFFHQLIQNMTNRFSSKFAIEKIITVKGRNWRVGRMGNCPPTFWQNRKCRQQQGHAAVLLTHSVLGSYLRLWLWQRITSAVFQNWNWNRNCIEGRPKLQFVISYLHIFLSIKQIYIDNIQ